jgi:copper chaperone CopZ
MEKLTVTLPAMYGDHHVIEVRNLLLAMPGVKSVYASSAFQVVEVAYDPAQQTTDTLQSVLEDAGYTGPLTVSAESGDPTYQRDHKARFFRHTAAYAQTGHTVGFVQHVSYSGRPLWPCPGMGTVQLMMEDEG